jgi:predicted nucleotidyltransferase
LEPRLHASLREAAATRGVSLNEHCATKLAAPSLELRSFGCAGDVVARAVELLGEGLVGVVVFGSWARGELAASSDVDVLIVLRPELPLTRSLYRRWDEAPLDWEGHPVEPHFVRLPEADEAPTGLWAEVALDGVVIFQKDPLLSRWLVRVRRLVADGRLCRRKAHGQPYWVEA